MLGYDEKGRRVNKTVRYEPYLFIPSKEPTEYKTIHGKYVAKMDFDNIWEARDFRKQYQDVHDFNIYGLDKWVYTYIYDTYKDSKEFEPNFGLMSIMPLDIEVSIGHEYRGKGFPEPSEANNPITLVTMESKGHFYTFGTQAYGKKMREDCTYVYCVSELDLLRKVISKWKDIDPDAITGWNTEAFDLPYLINRITKLLGREQAERLSPFGMLESRTFEYKGKELTCPYPVGLGNCDLQQLYMKFAFSQQERYSLDHIAEVELGRKKLEYDGTLADLEENDWDLYVDYNVVDVELVKLIDAKRSLIELAYSIAFDAGVNVNDVYSTVPVWDSLAHQHLRAEGKVVEPVRHRRPDRTIVGGYVKEPVPGMYGWTVSFDLTSLYPWIDIMYNISPETFVGKYHEVFTVDDVLNGFWDDPVRQQYLKDNNVTVAANGCMFTREKRGFIPAIMKRLFDNRKIFKDKMLDFKRALKAGTAGEGVEASISKWDNKQQSQKILLNSGYGALANEYFRWFELDFAEAITMSGQLSSRWIGNALNRLLNKVAKTQDFDYIIYQDTDSAYLNFDAIAKLCPKDENTVDFINRVCKEVITPFIDKEYEKLSGFVNAYENGMEMKREAICERSIFIAKKRYILKVWDNENVRYKEPEIKMTGVEAIRTSTPRVVRGAIKDAFWTMMNLTEDDLHVMVEKFRGEFNNMPFEQVAFPRGVSDIDKWTDSRGQAMKGTPIHVRAAINHNALVKEKKVTEKYEPITNAAKIKFAYLKSPNPCGSHVIAAHDQLPVEFGLQSYLDYGEQFDKTFLKPVGKVTDIIGWKLEKKASLEDWFA